MARQVQSKVKVILTVVFNHKGIVHEYTPDGQTDNEEYYIKVLCQLHNTVRHKWPASWKCGERQLHHDNTPAHSSHFVQNFLA